MSVFFHRSVSAMNLVLMAFARIVGRPRGKPCALADAREILVIRMDGIGDMVMNMAFLQSLREGCPEARITVVLDHRLLNLFDGNACADEWIGFNHISAGKPRALGLWLGAFRLMRTKLCNRCFDWVLLPRFDAEAYGGGFIALMSRAPNHAFFSELSAMNKRWVNKGFDRFFTHVIRDDTFRHEVDRSLYMLETLGVTCRDRQPRLALTQRDKKESLSLLDTIPLGSALIAVCPGALQQEKKWPLERFSQLVGRILEQFDCHVVVLGGPAEKVLGDALVGHVGGGTLNLAGRTTLGQTAAILQQCALCIGNDTGALHIAAALDVPVLMISCFSKSGRPDLLNSPKRFGPVGTQVVVVQPDRVLPPCVESCTAPDSHCIGQIGVDAVFMAAASLLQSGITCKAVHSST